MTDLESGDSMPIHLNVIDRHSVRALVAREGELMAKIATTGGNVHQYALDRQDEIQKFAATLSEKDSPMFWEIYTQEIMATSQTANNMLAAAQLKDVKAASNVATWISIIVFFVALIAIIKLFKG